MRLERGYLMDVQQDAVAMCVSRFTDVMDDLGDVSYFDDEFDSEEDFVLFYLGLRDYSHPIWGQHLDLTAFLPMIAPKLWEQWTNRYHRAIGERLIGAA